MQNREEQEVKNKINTITFMLLNKREVPIVGFTRLKKWFSSMKHSQNNSKTQTPVKHVTIYKDTQTKKQTIWR